jgi:O-antigen ligase
MLVGLLDSASFLMYLYGIPEMPFYATILTLKLAMTVYARVDLNGMRPALPFILITLLAIVVSTLANDVEPLSVYKSFAVLVSLSLTLALIRQHLRGYALGLSITGAVICVVYIVQVQRGMIGDHFGRMLFFGDNHPNLGGEILGMIVIMSALCLGPRLYFALAGAASYCVWLMQSRSGLLAILISAALYTMVSVAKAYGWRRCLIFASVAGFVLAFAVLAGVASGTRLVISAYDFFWNTLFLADDEYRGAGTGLTGRDHHWAEAMRIFLEHPFFGAGLDYPGRLDLIQPHNWFLYALAQFGLFGVLVVIAFLAVLVRAIWVGMNSVMVIVPVLALLLINDRFLNLNIYPLGMYVLVFALDRDSSLLSSRTPPRSPAPQLRG